MTTISRTGLQHQSCLKSLFVWKHHPNRLPTTAGRKTLHIHSIMRKK